MHRGAKPAAPASRACASTADCGGNPLLARRFPCPISPAPTRLGGTADGTEEPRTRILQLPPRLASPHDWDAALANLRRLLAGLHAHMAEIEAALGQLEAWRQAELAARHAAQSGER